MSKGSEAARRIHAEAIDLQRRSMPPTPAPRPDSRRAPRSRRLLRHAALVLAVVVAAAGLLLVFTAGPVTG